METEKALYEPIWKTRRERNQWGTEAGQRI